uniref:Uncharacterized protein LOC104227997 n=1 Tax=Nicotiana sylvestris TaxID=4096 RepID=A0A1U7WVH5_NICSY|nr:PREDICTED: uncharacterized protein LOC104227997 [Nicotiana sylvestris]
MYGFGYDKLHDDYKVVGITYERNNNYVVDWSHSHHVKLYSLNSHCWRSTDDFQSGMPVNGKSGMFVNGKLHWATSIHGINRDNGWDIISVNLADGKYGKVERPYYGEGDFEPKLGVVGSDLSAFCYYYGRTQTDIILASMSSELQRKYQNIDPTAIIEYLKKMVDTQLDIENSPVGPLVNHVIVLTKEHEKLGYKLVWYRSWAFDDHPLCVRVPAAAFTKTNRSRPRFLFLLRLRDTCVAFAKACPAPASRSRLFLRVHEGHIPSASKFLFANA